MRFLRQGGNSAEVLSDHADHISLAEFDAFQRSHLVRECLNFFDLALDNDNLKAVVMIQMDMGRGDDIQHMVVLQVQQFIRQRRRMVVINQKNPCYRVGGRFFQLFL